MSGTDIPVIDDPRVGIEQTPTRDFRSLVEVLRRHWLIVVGTTLVTVAAVLAIDLFLLTKQYRSDVEVLVQNEARDELGQTNLRDSERSMLNELSLAESRSVVGLVEERYGDEVEIAASIAEGRDVILLSAVDSDREQAQEIADFYSNAFLDARRDAALDDLLSASNVISDRISDLDQRIATLNEGRVNATAQAEINLLETQKELLSQRLEQLTLSSELTQTGTTRIISPANLPKTDEPVSPRPIRDGVIALAAGLILGISLAYVVGLIKDEVEAERGLETALTGVPTFSELPIESNSPGLAVLYQPASPFSEGIRRLRTAVRFVVPQHSIIQIASALPSDGKTVTSANLAYALEADGLRVLLIDADLRKRGLSELFGFGLETEGLTSVFRQEGDTTRLHFWKDSQASLWILPSGLTNEGPAELFGRLAFPRVLHHLRSSFDAIVIDSAPLIPVTDGALVARYVDSVLLVVGRKSEANDVTRARRTLASVGRKINGSVLNRGVRRQTSYGRYHEGYHSDRPGAAVGGRVPQAGEIRARFTPEPLELRIDAHGGVATVRRTPPHPNAVPAIPEAANTVVNEASPAPVATEPAPATTETQAESSPNADAILASLGVVDERVLFAPTSEIAAIDVTKPPPEADEADEADDSVVPTDQTVDLTKAAAQVNPSDDEQTLGESTEELTPNPSASNDSLPSEDLNDSVDEPAEAEVSSH